ncbi:FAD-dependent oxidoreductase [Nocardia cyriacigeorgica]|uniref:FAD-dependent oxidoreductase n=1 Tax=Nocardia cyriacigeorgica TaxID=135487 RepID=A0A6P1D6B4_9NOCA|nr:FAD-dependent oxidoreductase [Nocardia cyriacigeorgica]NEW41309.1 FAD-dependent oxidoreductase [Nocardia cyriacigeorgica]NEW44560.1 FAD-dependent oxidoreductase [Nocardia cyriacigeorgica]NEW52212.1 FAD-dependent oxidoreductase [Nocardia cyriacigeorgica]NEW55879.1 FAD-dependent oxidoreductase [Nocardia cyriacigeorgica]
MPAAPIVIVGAGLAGLRTAEELRRAGYEGELILLGDESRPPYDRPPLSKQFVRGETDDTTLRPAEFFTEKKIDLRLNQEAVGVDAEARRVRLADGSALDYSELIIATGLRPRRLPGLPDLGGVHVLRNHADAVALRSELGGARVALIIGAGFIGCELAASFRASGVEVVLVEPQPTPLASVLGEQVGALVARMHRNEGVDLRCGTGVDSLLADDDNKVRGALLTDGSEVAADLVVIGVGSRPVTEWLADSGIELAEPAAGGGVLADEVGRTSAAGVWAVGDVAAWLHDTGARKRVEHWTNAGEQAKLLACALLGAEPPTAARVPYFWSDQYDVKIQALGTPGATDEMRIVSDDGRKFLVYYTQDGRLTGVVGAGMTAQVMKTRAKIAAGAPVAELLGAS